MKILVFATGGLGDFIFTIPAIVKIKQQFGTSKIDLVTYSIFDKRHDSLPAWISLVEHLFNKIYSIDELSTTGQCKAHTYSRIYILCGGGTRLLSWLKRYMFFLLKAHFKFFKIRTNFNVIQFDNLGLHKSHGPVSCIDNKILNSRYHRSSNISDLKRLVSHYQKTNKINIQNNENSKVIGIFPGSKLKWKAWPPENYVRLCNYVSDNHPDYQISIFGENNDSALLDQFRSINYNNKIGITFSNLITTLKATKLVICNDGGAGHLAALLGCKVITLSNGSEPNLVTPLGKNVNEIRTITNCMGCGAKDSCPIGDPICITKTEVNRIIQAMDLLL